MFPPQVLLLTYKAQLACLGGIRELARAKKVARELANLPTINENPGKLRLYQYRRHLIQIAQPWP